MVRHTAIYRPQDKDYAHKGWGGSYDALETSEKIPRRSRKPQSNANEAVVETDFRIFRPIDVRPERGVSDESAEKSRLLFNLDMFLAEECEHYKERWPKRKSTILPLDKLAVTYFGDYVIRQAILNSTNRAYRNFMVDVKQSRDISNRLKGSFIDFMRDASIVQSAMADPTLNSEFFGESDLAWQSDRLLSGDELALARPKKWSSITADIAPVSLLLNRAHRKFIAFDMSQNQDLIEERQEIKDFFRTEHQLFFKDDIGGDKGQFMKNTMHITWMRAAEDEWQYMVADTPLSPESIPLNPPQARFRISS